MLAADTHALGVPDGVKKCQPLWRLSSCGNCIVPQAREQRQPSLPQFDGRNASTMVLSANTDSETGGLVASKCTPYQPNDRILTESPAL